MKPLLQQKCCDQNLGLLHKQDFLELLYDVFIGIRWHGHQKQDLQ
jgi:beta-carotene hydroxylase